jgi:hypothetical protein
MRNRHSISLAFVILALIYAASPYVALWRLERALDHGDTQALERGVDWPSVRAGLKQDIAEGIIGPVPTNLAATTLPPFGASFIAGIADTAVDHDVTPQNLVAVMRQMRQEPEPYLLSRFSWAFFESPTLFGVTVRTSDDEDGHLRLRLALRGGRWTLIRAWIPQDIIERASQRT